MLQLGEMIFVRQGAYKMTLPFSLANFVNLLGEDDVLIIRPHYLVAASINIKGFEKKVRICVNEDINDLYLISDLLITDYSSVMFDYAILNRPMLFYPYDLAHYQDEIRGFYFDYNKVPGPAVTDEASFYEQIKVFLNKGLFSGYLERLGDFRKKFTTWERGTSSERVVKLIENISCNKKGRD